MLVKKLFVLGKNYSYVIHEQSGRLKTPATRTSIVCTEMNGDVRNVTKGGAPNSGRFLIPDKRSFMPDFSETHWCILANLIPQVDLS